MLQALAIKYRPKTFDELIGQKTISTSLKYALNNQRLAHAYLFSGLRGSGKTSSARIFARALVCEKGPIDTPCQICHQCLASLEGRHMDIIEMDAASHRGLDDIQELIEQTKYAPSMARFKIFIIDEVHMLTTQAANALLKTLEEPPKYVKFILATTDPLKLPATVLSRTQHFRFRQIAQNDIINHLEYILKQENINDFELDALKLLARSGQGSLRDTLTLLDQAIIYSSSELKSAKIADMLGFLDPDKVGEFYKILLNKDKDKTLEFLKSLQDYEASTVIDEMAFYLKEKFFAKSNEFSTLMYERFFHILSRAKNMLKICDDDGFVLCVMAFMMIEASNIESIDEAIIKAKEELQNPINIPSNNTPKPKDPYELLSNEIYNRDYELGEVWAKYTKFISFEDKKFIISSSAKGKDRDMLNEKFNILQKLCSDKLDAQIIVQKTEEKIEKNTNFDLDKELNMLKANASSKNPQEESKQALEECFGKPKVL